MTGETPFAAARLWAATRTPYLASALFACVPVDAPDTGAITVDRSWHVHVDPVVAGQLGAPELGALLIHLVGHLVRDHAGRAEQLGVDEPAAQWWNVCGDAEINDDLVDAQLLPPMRPTVPADLPAPAGQLVETYFALRPQESVPVRPDGPGPVGCGSGADGIDRPGDGAAGEPALDAEQAQRLRHFVADEMTRAHERDPGSVPAGWLRWAESVLDSRTDWRRILAAEVRRAVAAVRGSVDYTYRRPSRRSHTAADAQARVVLPSMFRPVPEVAVVCDTSGSMDDEALTRVLVEVDAILARAGLRSAGVQALAVDTEVHTSGRVRRAAEVALAGGGGTDMGAGIVAALERRPRPEVVVVLTDGMTPWPEARPRGARVVVGVLVQEGWDVPPTPEWARRVDIPL